MTYIRCIAVLLFAATAYGQIFANPASLSFTQRQSGDSPYPFPVTITGSGSISLGTCSGTACPAILTEINSSTAPATIYFYWNGYTNDDFAPGVYTASFPVIGSNGCGAGCSIDISLTVAPVNSPTMVNRDFGGLGSDGNGPMLWDSYDSHTYYYLRNLSIHKVTLASPRHASSDVIWYTYPGAATQITTGGEGNTSADNWLAFWADTGKKMGLINLSDPAEVYFGDLSRLPDYKFRACTVSKGADSLTGKRYVVAEDNSGGPNEILSYSPGGATLTDEGAIPRSAGSFHSNAVEVSGVQYYVYPQRQDSGLGERVAFMRFNAGTGLMSTAAENGGGMSYAPDSAGNGAVHVRCAKQAPVCAVETESGDRAAHNQTEIVGIDATGIASGIFKANNLTIRRGRGVGSPPGVSEAAVDSGPRLAPLAITPSTQTTFNFSQRERGTVPYTQDYAVGGTGPITIGQCSGSTLCSSLETALTGASAPATLHIFWIGYGPNEAPPGSYTMTLPVTSSVGVTLTINLQIVPRTVPRVISPSGVFNGCANSTPTYFPDLDTCTVAQGYPGRGQFAIPARGSTYIDPNFGGSVRTLTPISGLRALFADSAKSAFNSDHTILFTETVSGHLYGTDPVTGNDVWDFQALGVCGDPIWSGVKPWLFYCSDYSANTLFSVTLTAPPTSWSKSAPLYTYPGGRAAAQGLSSGGDGDTSKDDWRCWFTQFGADKKIAMVNMANPAAQTYLADFSGLPHSTNACGNGDTVPCGRACTISKGADKVDGARYIVFSFGPDYELEIYRWRPGDAALTDLGAAAQDPNSPNRSTPTYSGNHCDTSAIIVNNCLPSTHEDTVEVNGHQYLALPVQEGQPYILNMAFVRLDDPDNMYTSAEVGGGMYRAYIPQAVPFGGDVHIGCAKSAPVCIMETDQDPQVVTYSVTGASNTAPIHITSGRACGDNTFCPTYAAANGDVLRFGGLAGNTALNNGSCTVVNASGSSFDCAGSDGTRSGAYSSGGFFIPDITPVAWPHQGEIALIDATNLETNQFTITRLAKHRDWMISGQQVIWYYGQSHPVISADGTLAAFESNFGYPEQLGVFGIPTGYSSLNPISVPGAPVVSISSPAAGSNVSGKSLIVSGTATASPGLGVASVQFKLDSGNLGGAIQGVGPYSVTLDTTALINGAHLLSAVAVDSAGNSAASPAISVTVNNGAGPSVAITAPSAGATVSGTGVTLSASAAPAAGAAIASVQFTVDGIATGEPVTTAPYQITFNSTTLADGTHIISAIATDSVGNSGAAAAVTVTSANTGAQVPATELITGFTSDPFSARSDSTGARGMQFTVGAAPLTVGSLGRMFIFGNQGTHTVKLVRASDGTDVPGGSVDVNMAGGKSNQFQYAKLASPVILPANTAYYLMSQEVAGGDQWYDFNPVTSTAAANVNGPAYTYLQQNELLAIGAYAYIPVSLLYAGPAAAPAVSISAPSAGSNLSGKSAVVSANATAPAGRSIAGVQLEVDNGNLGRAVQGAGPYNFTLDTTALPNGAHSLAVVATDSSGSSATSPAVRVTVINSAAPPTVAITAPSSGAVIAGKSFVVTASAMASTGLSLSGVQLKADGSNFGPLLTGSGPYSTPLDTTALTNGPHTLTAVATDSAGRSGTSTGVAVTVNNVSTSVSITAPTAGATVSGKSVTVSATATAASGLSVRSAQFKLDNSNLGALIQGAGPYSVTLDTTALVNGSHSLSAVVTDSSGITASSTPVQIAVNNTVPPPVVSITAPAAGATVSGKSVTVSGTATAGTGLRISSVQFKLDNANLGAPIQGTGPYSVILDTTALVNGSHSLSAAATDSSGITSTSASISVTVNNSSGATVLITAPAAATTVSGKSVAIAAAANPGTGLSIASLQFQIDGSNTGASISGPGPYASTFDSTALSNGSHTLTAVCKDLGGNAVTSPGVAVLVSNSSGNPPSNTVPFVTAQTLGFARNSFTGDLGMQFTIGAAPVTVSALGRIYIAGNHLQHTVKLVQASTGQDLPGGAVSITMSAPANGLYQYANLASPITLQANTAYILVTHETYGGDQWYDYGSVTGTNAASINGPAYFAGYGYAAIAIANNSYGPVNFQYGGSSNPLPPPVPAGAPSVAITAPASGATVSGKQVTVSATATAASGLTISRVQFSANGQPLNGTVAASGSTYSITLDSTVLANGVYNITAVAVDSSGNSATSASVSVTVANTAPPPPTGTPFLTGQTVSASRNDFSGQVGMNFTVGSAPVTVTQLGRLFAPGNSGTHLLKLARADGSDVPNGSVSLSMTGGTAGAYQYAALPAPVVLQANASYYLVSQETSGGDFWYDYSPVISTSAAFVNGPAYYLGTYAALDIPNYAYVPVNFLYQ